jgi:dTDP-4-dehydrorhamnose reductase
MKILVFGSNGMIGSTVFRYLDKYTNCNTVGALRDSQNKLLLLKNTYYIDSYNFQNLYKCINLIRPDYVINCVGITKHRKLSNNIIKSLQINSIIPHNISLLCKIFNARLIQISTDCIFSGLKGNYIESDLPDALDIYGKTKFLGEVKESHVLNIRTSTIGHEIIGANGLLEWFLASNKSVDGYRNAFFSGITTLELAKVICFIIENNFILSGVYNVGGMKVDKYTLLKLIAFVYNKKIKINEDLTFNIDRSFISDKFVSETGYVISNWEKLIKECFDFYNYEKEFYVRQ